MGVNLRGFHIVVETFWLKVLLRICAVEQALRLGMVSLDALGCYENSWVYEGCQLGYFAAFTTSAPVTASV